MYHPANIRCLKRYYVMIFSSFLTHICTEGAPLKARSNSLLNKNAHSPPLSKASNSPSAVIVPNVIQPFQLANEGSGQVFNYTHQWYPAYYINLIMFNRFQKRFGSMPYILITVFIINM